MSLIIWIACAKVGYAQDGPYIDLYSPFIDAAEGRDSVDFNGVDTDRRLDLSFGYYNGPGDMFEMEAGAIVTGYAIAAGDGYNFQAALKAAVASHFFFAPDLLGTSVGYSYGPFLAAHGSTHMYGECAGRRRAVVSCMGIDGTVGFRYPVESGPYGRLELGYKLSYDRERGRSDAGMIINIGVGAR